MPILKFELPTIKCAACKAPVESVIRELGYNDKDFRVDIIKKNLQIQTEKTDARTVKAIIQAIEEIGFDVGYTPYNPNYTKHLIKSGIGLISGFGILALSLSGIGLPFGVMWGLTIGSSVLSLILGSDSFFEAAKKLYYGRILEMNALFTVSSFITIASSIGAMFVPWLPMMLDAALLTFGFRHLGIALEERAKQKVAANLDFKQRAPRKVFVCRNPDGKTFVEMAIENILPGDIIRLQKGQTIPLDGELITQNAWINTEIIDGSLYSREMNQTTEIFAGMKIAKRNSYPVDIIVKRNEENSFLAKLDNDIALAEMNKAPLELAAEKILKYFVPAVFGIAAVAAVVVGGIFSPSLAIQFATSLLVSACPCTLGTIVPIAVSVGMSKAATHGILFKTGDAIEAAAKIDTVVFDLTGTLTKGERKVRNIIFTDTKNKEKLPAILFALEKNASHPIAKAICQHLKTEKLVNTTTTLKTQNIANAHHAGAELMIDDEHYRIGNLNMLAAANIHLNTEHQHIITSHPHDEVVFISRGTEIIGHVVLSNEVIKAEAMETIQELKQQSKEIHLCTGVSQEVAKHYATELKIPLTNIKYNCKPADKVEYIKTLKAAGKIVAMIGDAQNDAPSLVESHLGVLVKSTASNATLQTKPKVIIQNTTLASVANIFKVADETVKNIKQNLAISFTYNFATLALSSVLMFGLGFALNPGVGVALMVLQASFVLLNVFRFSQRPLTTPANDPLLALPTNNTSLFKYFGLSVHSFSFTRECENDKKIIHEETTTRLLSPHSTPSVQQYFQYHRSPGLK